MTYDLAIVYFGSLLGLESWNIRYAGWICVS